MNKMNRIIIVIANPIHIGDNTHNHDHVITLHSFNVINTIVSSPPKLIPLFAPLFFFDIGMWFKLVIKYYARIGAGA